MKVFKQISVILFVSFIVSFFMQCSGRKALERGDYAEAVYKSVKKLRSSPNHKKSAQVLREAYPLAVNYYKTQIENTLTSNDPFKWNSVYSYMSTVNGMGDDIQRCPAALKIITKPFMYTQEYAKARLNAAEEYYIAGKQELAKNSKLAARQAYYHFVNANKLEPNYKDASKLMQDAKEMAMVRVVLEKIPLGVGRFQYSSDFFQNNVESFLASHFNNKDFLELYTPQQAERERLVPDHIVRIQFENFMVGNTDVNRNSTIVTSKDSVVVGELAMPNGSKMPVKNLVKATLTTYRKTVTSNGSVEVQIVDFVSKKVLSQNRFPGEYVWVCEWGNFNGDERALTPKEKSLCKQRELMPPSTQDLFVEFTKPIYTQVTNSLSSFYSRY